MRTLRDLNYPHLLNFDPDVLAFTGMLKSIKKQTIMLM
jgi:hypothetical protein